VFFSVQLEVIELKNDRIRLAAVERHPSERDLKLRILLFFCLCGQSPEPPDRFPRNQRMGAFADTLSYMIDCELGTAGSTPGAVAYKVPCLLRSDFENRRIGKPYSRHNIYRRLVC
jgi:hypothetical protein